MKQKINFNTVQHNAGDLPAKLQQTSGKKKIFHTDSKGLWWSGWHIADYTTQELLDLARSVEADLLRQYPDLK